MCKSVSSRQKIIETTSRLLQQQGYHTTGLNQIVQESDCPKGSLYHYFPKGKEELTCEAIRFTRDRGAKQIKDGLAAAGDPAQAIKAFIEGIGAAVVGGGCNQNMPIAAVALEIAPVNDAIREACREAYETWHQVFADKLQEHGFPQAKAESLARVINAMIEGAITICLTRQDDQALRDIANYIPILLG